MAIEASTFGAVWEPLALVLDARRVMAFAAGLGDRGPELYDTTRPDGIVVHPMFPVAPEWELLTRAGGPLTDLDARAAARGVHATHDLCIHRPIRPDDKVELTATVVGVERTKAGALRTIRFDAVGEGSTPLWTTYLGAIHRGVDLVGDDCVDPSVPALGRHGGGVVIDEQRLEVGPLDALVYSECARIWNPIHTDAAIAIGAGLPGPILHGTATLGRAVSAVVDMLGAGHDEVRRIAGRFRAPVVLGSHIVVELTAGGDDPRFQVRNAAGEIALADGIVRLR